MQRGLVLPSITWPVIGRVTPRSVQYQSLKFFLLGERGHVTDSFFIIQIIQIERQKQSSHCGAVEMSLTRTHKVVCSIPGLTQWVKDLVLL